MVKVVVEDKDKEMTEEQKAKELEI